MKKPILCTVAICFIFMFSCKKDEDSDDIANKSLLVVPGDYPSIQAAINASSHGDTIIVDPGTYTENINFNGKEVIVQSRNPEDQGNVETTIIDGNSEGTVVTFDSGETESAVLNGFTIINGDAGTSNGGGILITNSSNPVVKNNTITGNEAKYGAGICVSGESQPSFINNIIKTNTADGSRGAGIYVIGMSSATIDNNVFKDHTDCDGVIHIGSTYTDECDAVITNNTIENNTTTYGTGGIKVTSVSTAIISDNTITDNTGVGDVSAAAISICKTSQADIIDNIITGNDGKQNGAIIVYDECEATISGNTITGNSAGIQGEPSGTGGGITVSTNSTVDISNNDISDNYAWSLNHGGGGIIVSYSSDVSIDNNQILNNNAYRYGGGIYVAIGSGNNVTITNNDISGNDADGYGASNGGGIYMDNVIEAVIYGNDIEDNWAQKNGGGIYIDDVETLVGNENTAWVRMNAPEEPEPHNTYHNNTHGDNSEGGADVYYRD